MQSAKLRSGKEMKLLRETDVITEFESYIRCGLTSVDHGKIASNNKYFLTYDQIILIFTGIFWR